jgi:Mrp family chromosome partitioning ATPase
MSEKIGKHIAIYGKGGIGKCTTTSNISAALAEAGTVGGELAAGAFVNLRYTW